MLVLFASTKLSFVSGVDGTRQDGSRINECMFRTSPPISAATDEGDSTAGTLHMPQSFGTLYSAESLAESGAGYACYAAKPFSSSLFSVSTAKRVRAALTAHESIGDTRNTKSAGAHVFNGEPDLWRDQEMWVTAQSFRKSKQIIKTKKEYGITDDVDASDRGEWGHSSKEYSGPSSRQTETPKCTKTLHHKSLYVPGTFIPGEISPGVKVQRTPPALIPGTPGFWEPGRSPYYTPGFWTPGYGPRYVSAVPAAILPGKKGTVIPGLFFPPAYSPGYLIPGWYETMSCALLCSMPTCQEAECFKLPQVTGVKVNTTGPLTRHM